MAPNVLIVNGNTAEGTARIVSLGGRPYGEGYADALRFFEPRLDVTILDAAEGEALPAGVALADFDGVAWTGSALSAYEDRPEVARQIELARAVHASGVPSFGSCWGQQIMCQALGGAVRANPKGIEIGVARAIGHTDTGRGHPMYSGKADTFDALAIHRDEVVTLPAGARILAANSVSTIQAMDLGKDSAFWGVQYHPEFNLALMGTIFRREEKTLVDQGHYADSGAVADAIADFAALDDDPSDTTVAGKCALGPDILDPACRMAELGNWLRLKVLPGAGA